METQIKKITNVQLTDEELNLIIDALDNLPHKSDAGNMMGDLLGMVLTKDTDESKDKIEQDRAKRQAIYTSEKNKIKKEIEIVKAKIILAQVQTDN